MCILHNDIYCGHAMRSCQVGQVGQVELMLHSVLKKFHSFGLATAVTVA
jgi:hypothetical protein